MTDEKQATVSTGAQSPLWRRALFLAVAAATLAPFATPALALGAGIAFALVLGNPFARSSARYSKLLLQACVVGLGFGMPLAAVLRAGASGVAYTIAGIATAIVLGLLIGHWLRVHGETSLLITAGTSICGGSAIAAVGPAIGAREEAMGIALATVFVLNAVALYLFPPIGHLLHLTQRQFAVWAAIAIHDTSSVVGAAAQYGPEALQRATVLKLARALWIVPLTIAAAAWARRRDAAGQGQGTGASVASGAPAAPAERPRVKLPWFIGFFLLAAVVRTFAPMGLDPALNALAALARAGLALTLFLIGAGLTRAVLERVGVRPMLQGVLLWGAVGTLTLLAVYRFVAP
ncbi:MAG TPA: putative sulfate exporter family transporter [Longimicrobiales bacterium]